MISEPPGLTTVGIRGEAQSWHAREQQRLVDGTYSRLPWDEFWNVADPIHKIMRRYHWFHAKRKPEALHHYPHISTKQKGCISFTETDAKGAVDVQNPGMRPGRYLSKFFNLSPEEVKRQANRFTALFGNVTLKFARTQDEIEHVYTSGPENCMSKDAGHFAGHYHPARVYGMDVTVTYLLVEKSRYISSRCIAWEARKVFGRVQGDGDQLSHALRNAGYQSDDGSLFDGAKLHKIPFGDDGFIMPLLDNGYGVDDCGDHFRMAKGLNGEYSCHQVHGLIGRANWRREPHERIDAQLAAMQEANAIAHAMFER